MSNRITDLFGIKYPIIQGGMVWCSGWRLADAVSNAGGLGLIGSGSMKPEVLREHIFKCKAATQKPFGVNVPLAFSGTEEYLNVNLLPQFKDEYLYRYIIDGKKLVMLTEDNFSKYVNTKVKMRSPMFNEK